jgi:hypothetical protein
VAQAKRRENRPEPQSGEAIKPLVDEYLASTREPVGSSDLFGPKQSSSSISGPRVQQSGPARSAPIAWRALLVCFVGLIGLVAAAAVIFLAP